MCITHTCKTARQNYNWRGTCVSRAIMYACAQTNMPLNFELCKLMHEKAMAEGNAALVYECPLCHTFCTSDYRLWLSHLGQVHRNEPSFRVMYGYRGCAETKKSYSSLYSHVYRKHPELVRKRSRVSTEEDPLPNFSSFCEANDEMVPLQFSGMLLHLIAN